MLESRAIELVRAYIKRRDPRAVDAKYHPQIWFDYSAVNRMLRLGRELMDLVSPERGMEGIAFKGLPGLPDGGFLRWSEPVKISPKFLYARY